VTQATTPRRPARRAPGRKELIIEAAVGVLAEHGVAGTTHRLVAQAADVPLGSLTYYFTSLADLREQAFRWHARRLSDRYAAFFDAVATREDLLDAVTDLIHRQIGADARDMVLAYELYLAAMREPALRAVTEDWMHTSRAVLERFLDPVTARGVDALVEGLIMHNALSPTPLGRDEIRTIVARTMT
jgi:DNA-binding transcriptional regulator YbjK